MSIFFTVQEIDNDAPFSGSFLKLVEDILDYVARSVFRFFNRDQEPNPLQSRAAERLEQYVKILLIDLVTTQIK